MRVPQPTGTAKLRSWLAAAGVSTGVTTFRCDFRECVLQLSIPGAAARGGVSDLTSHHRERHHEVCLDVHEPPDLDAAVPEERQAEVYQAIYGWFEKHGHVMADSGAELQGPETAMTVKNGPNGGEPVVVDGPFFRRRRMSEGSASSTFPTSMPRSPLSRSGRRCSIPALRWRSGRSWTTAALCERRARLLSSAALGGGWQPEEGGRGETGQSWRLAVSLAARRRAIDLLRKRSREVPLADEWDAGPRLGRGLHKTTDPSD